MVAVCVVRVVVMIIDIDKETTEIHECGRERHTCIHFELERIELRLASCPDGRDTPDRQRVANRISARVELIALEFGGETRHVVKITSVARAILERAADHHAVQIVHESGICLGHRPTIFLLEPKLQIGKVCRLRLPE